MGNDALLGGKTNNSHGVLFERGGEFPYHCRQFDIGRLNLIDFWSIVNYYIAMSKVTQTIFSGFFPYYGRKHVLVKRGLYPAPLPNSVIIEPFAGSASYSLRHYEHEVILVEQDPWVVKVWHYLQQASPSDILGLPILSSKDNLSQYKLSEPERLFIGYNLARAINRPQYKPQQRNNWTPAMRQVIADNLYRIKHWKIIQDNYQKIDFPNHEGITWFIDPPYACGGQKYRYHNKKLDYEALARFIYSRKGLTLACEHVGCCWLKGVNHLTFLRGAMFTRDEGLYCQYPS